MMSKEKKTKRKKVKGKGKGSAFEREISKNLSLWLTNGDNPDCIWRTAGSGAKSTVTNSVSMVGDLMAVRPEAIKFFSKITIELKNYNSLDLLTINNKTFKILDWWEQVSEDSLRANTEPLLIFKINRKGTWVAFKESMRQYIRKNKEFKNCNLILLYLDNIEECLILMPYDKFLDNLDRNKF